MDTKLRLVEKGRKVLEVPLTYEEKEENKELLAEITSTQLPDAESEFDNLKKAYKKKIDDLKKRQVEIAEEIKTGHKKSSVDCETVYCPNHNVIYVYRCDNYKKIDSFTAAEKKIQFEAEEPLLNYSYEIVGV